MDISRYKALLFDVDNTLTLSVRDIPARIGIALASVSKRGMLTGVCTGRSILSLRDHVLPLFPEESLHIVCGGSQIITSRGNIQFSRGIPIEHAKDLAGKLDQESVPFIWQCSDAFYGNTAMIEKGDGSDRSESYRQWLTTILPYQTCPHTEIPIMTIYQVSDTVTGIVATFPRIVYKEMLSSIGLPYIDVTADGVTKAIGVKEWCKIQGISVDEVIGFGDSSNDLEFLKTVGYAVAMGNATEDVKSIADEVALDCAHVGVADWIERNLYE